MTLTLMLIDGALSRACSERGAPGFSNERSLTYWARMLSDGLCCALPLPLDAVSVVIRVSSTSIR
ncbi:hypothetical protein D3C85_1741530 [compost metagenome]